MQKYGHKDRDDENIFLDDHADEYEEDGDENEDGDEDEEGENNGNGDEIDDGNTEGDDQELDVEAEESGQELDQDSGDEENLESRAIECALTIPSLFPPTNLLA